MWGSERISLRLVVQRISQAGKSRYRLIAYGDGTYRPVDLESRDEMLLAVRLIVPNFSERSLREQDESLDAQIVYADEVTVDSQQLRLVGLRAQAGRGKLGLDIARLSRN